MFENIALSQNISFMIVFVEGLLSFFSPCVIPLIPVYISYLSGNASQVNEYGLMVYNRKKLFFHTICFVLGISFAFFILGMSFTALGSFFQSHRLLFTRIGGIVIVFLGLFQIGFLNFYFLQRERKFHLSLGTKKINPLLAFIMGFTFSFAWTPCVGPALSSVLIMASSSKSALSGNLLVLIYAIGFIIPFLLLGLFTTQALNFLKHKRNFMKYTVKIGGGLLILIGIMTFTGWMNNLSSYLNTYTSPSKSNEKEQAAQTAEKANEPSQPAETPDSADTVREKDAPQTPDLMPAIDFTLTDQYGNKHTLSDYKGKVVFLNFWATWCPPCREEMPHIEELYTTYGQNNDEVIFLGVANPKTDAYPHNQDVEKDEIATFLQDNGYTFPTVFDETGEFFNQYAISAFPTTFMITKEGNIYGYVPGMLTKDMMQNIIEQTLNPVD
jgi:cytochrome c-type biogenesis protein